MRAVSDLRSILSGGRGSLSAAAHARGVDSLSPRARWSGPSELVARAWTDDHVLDDSRIPLFCSEIQYFWPRLIFFIIIILVCS